MSNEQGARAGASEAGAEQEQEQKQGGWPHRSRSRSRSHHPPPGARRPPRSQAWEGRWRRLLCNNLITSGAVNCRPDSNSRKSMNAVRARDQIYRPCPQSSLRCETEHGNESKKSRTQNPSKPYHMFGPSFLCLFFFAERTTLIARLEGLRRAK